ncbi:adenosylcobalamin-dependent ribonucleoside-diphosphate reductase [Phaeodactylibacter sp.]|jgi:ribonucleoside-diphosphate reductase alpha chain|uniref:adenosylcobalamin-dependent ribonucleoside-diphosphate reductase n=2 Tax=Phaeodactylibacter sp. TaxID=1940289 RepID=UPI0025D74992|nr:adenosylcobalamin-dependent ribonucleoside-diphosphate reductase [Phaeodactylibacter sp.]MCI5090610.1 adenosylcobalamin-dependent ribonucleoside-diphosphate reductase [Phaeodactylibacter sp.]
METPAVSTPKVKSYTEKYTFEEALKASVAYFNGDDLAANVWVNKYALKDSYGNIYERTPDDMHRRIAAEIARIEARYPEPLSEEEVYAVLKDFKYIVPQGSPMAGIGNPFQISSLSNCFVIGSGADSYGGIAKADEEQVQLMKRRGGVGQDLSHLRPKGSPVMNSALSSTGIVPFMERYSNSTREVAQDGRRGALMLTVSSRHPDAEGFIDAKLEQGKVTGANVSVRIDDDFMKAAIEGKPYQQQYPVDSPNPAFKKDADAQKLWKKIIQNAWKSAEPGVLFWDTIIRESVPDCYADLGYRTISTNPCGEIPLCPYDSCRLLAINLYSYVENPFTPKAKFNFEKFGQHVQMAQRIMDDIIDLEIEKIDRILEKIEKDPEAEDIKATEYELWKKIRKTCVQGRRTGVGITAEGDMLASLGLRYGSDEAISFSVDVHRTLAVNAYRSSAIMAKERGAFPIFDAEREAENPFINRLREADPALYEEMLAHGRRNIALLTIAPTGTTSLMTQTASGIEPAFLITYKRRRKVNPNDKEANVTFIDEVGDHWEEYNVFHHKFLVWLEANGYDVDKVRRMSTDELTPIIEQSPYHLATANDVDWVQKVKMQGAIQKWVDHSISVTVNIPEETSVEMVQKIYETAWKEGCKGCTIYRDGSRSGVLVSDKEKKTGAANEFQETMPPKRPEVLEAAVVRFKNNAEDWIAVIGLYANRPYEIFTGKSEDIFIIPGYVTKGWVMKNTDDEGHNRYDLQFEDKQGYRVTIEGLSRSFDKEYWNYAKLISGVLRHGMPIPYVVDLVEGLNVEEDYINTWKNGVVRALKQFVPDGTKAADSACPSCNDADGLIYKEGCLICKSCGYSECG